MHKGTKEFEKVRQACAPDAVPQPQTPHAHYMDHILDNGPPSSWYWKQVGDPPMLEVSDDEGGVQCN